MQNLAAASVSEGGGAPEATSPATTPLINTMLEVEGLANSVYPLHLLSQVPGIRSSAEDIKE